MPLFQIVPTDPPGDPIEIEAADGTAALYLVSARGLTDADVWCDGRYVFSARMQGAPTAFWAIFQREELRNVAQLHSSRAGPDER